MKVKELFIRQLEDEFELELSYQEWLRDNFSEPDENELNEMNKDLNKPSFVSNQIIAHKPLNKTNYNPKYGA